MATSARLGNAHARAALSLSKSSKAAQKADLANRHSDDVQQEDGGDIVYQGFEEASGRVLLEMRGACSGCPSSAVFDLASYRLHCVVPYIWL